MGQEKATIGFDEDVKITPFNIDEELEEGHYDPSGCFQWKKKDVRSTIQFSFFSSKSNRFVFHWI